MKPAAKPAPALFDSKEIYLVESEEDPTALIAKGAGIQQGHLFWDDTNRERIFRVAEVKSSPIVVRTVEGATYRFTPLTLELYESKVRRHVELSPKFDSTEALKKFYRTSSFG